MSEGLSTPDCSYCAGVGWLLLGQVIAGTSRVHWEDDALVACICRPEVWT